MTYGRCCLVISAIRCLSDPSRIYNSHKSIAACRDYSVLSAVSKRMIQNPLKPLLRMASTSGNPPSVRKNKLALEKSAYLLQHASNPVDWYPWCDEALERAKREDKLIFLSVGYSTCHWCHVMERESFMDENIAKFMNEYFVNIKVDREERPDLDKIYMKFVQNIYGQGGWPMNVFLTPQLIPVMGGTYFPPVPKHGQPSFERVLLTFAHKWRERKQDLIRSGTDIVDIFRQMEKSEHSDRTAVPSADCADKCIHQLIKSFDVEFGGFSQAPKFPQPVNMSLLFHMYARNPQSDLGKQCLEMCTETLTKVANGGIHDHVGQGFSRYSIDSKWHVPHFEKMLYDQGQLLSSYSSAWLVTKDEFYKEIIDDIVTYINRDLRHIEGGYFSAEDADSFPSAGSVEMKEGAFYVWELEEIESLLSKEIRENLRLSDVYCYHYNVKKGGNVECHHDPEYDLKDKNVLIILGSLEKTAEKFQLKVDDLKGFLQEANGILFQERCKRPRPHLDAKIVAGWNGLMISGLSHAGSATENENYVQYAIVAAKFVEKYLFDKEQGILFRSCYRGKNDVIEQPSVPIHGFDADYAFMVQGLIDLYEASLDEHWLEFATKLQDKQDQLFWDAEEGGYFNTTQDDQNIILRLKNEHDGAEPSSNAIACNNLLRLSAALEREDYEKKAEAILKYFQETLDKVPIAFPKMVCALLCYYDAMTQIHVIGNKDSEETKTLLKVIRSRLLPAKIVIHMDPNSPSTIITRENQSVSKMKSQNGRSAVYVCRHRTCSMPIVEPNQLAEHLDTAQ